MNILFLTNENADKKEDLTDLLELYGESFIEYYDKISLEYVKKNRIDFILSDRYSHIVKPEVLSYLEGNAINTHPSILPLNKGWQPIFFSVLNHNKVGVSIHLIDEGLDTGDLLLQDEIFTSQEDTLRTLHYVCRRTIVYLLSKNWKKIVNKQITPMKQNFKGTYFYKKEFEKFFNMLEKGWDSNIKEVQNLSKYL